MIVAGLDIETTGLDQEKGHRIIEIALVIFRLEDQLEIGKFVTRVNPQRSIDAKAQEVHGIAIEDLIACPIWTVVGPKVAALMSNCDLFVAHNGKWFDLPFIAGELIRIGQRVPDGQVIDTCADARWATPNGKMPNLAELCFACGVVYDTKLAHGAEYDVRVMMECFFKAQARGLFQLVPQAA